MRRNFAGIWTIKFAKKFPCISMRPLAQWENIWRQKFQSCVNKFSPSHPGECKYFFISLKRAALSGDKNPERPKAVYIYIIKANIRKHPCVRVVSHQGPCYFICIRYKKGGKRSTTEPKSFEMLLNILFHVKPPSAQSENVGSWRESPPKLAR